MKIVSIINYKGGVGKTTITANLGAGLSKRGYKVLIIDLDPQSNLTFSFIEIEKWKKDYAKTKTIRDWFSEGNFSSKNNEFKNLIVKSTALKQDNLDIICSHIGLINTDLELASRMNAVTNRSQREQFVKVHNILKDGIKEIEEENYDVVLIDCPPNFNLITRNALVTSDYYLVPIKLDYLSTLGLDELNKHIKSLEADYNSNITDSNDYISPQFLGVICNMVSRKGEGLISAENDYIGKLKRSNSFIFNTKLRENKTVHANAPMEGIPVIMKKASGITYKGVKKELENLVDEFIERAGL